MISITFRIVHERTLQNIKRLKGPPERGASRNFHYILSVSLRVPKCMSKRSGYVSRKRHYRLSLLLVTRPLVVSDSSRVREVHSRFFAKYYSIPVKRYLGIESTEIHEYILNLRPIPTLGHSPFSLSLSRIHTQTHTHIHSLFTLPSSFFLFLFPVLCRASRCICQCVSGSCAASIFWFYLFCFLLSFSVLELRPRFLRFDIVYRSTMPRADFRLSRT